MCFKKKNYNIQTVFGVIDIKWFEECKLIPVKSCHLKSYNDMSLKLYVATLVCCKLFYRWKKKYRAKINIDPTIKMHLAKPLPKDSEGESKFCEGFFKKIFAIWCQY